jgi:hypothetical protein
MKEGGDFLKKFPSTRAVSDHDRPCKAHGHRLGIIAIQLTGVIRIAA